jgi:Ubiquitin carboxyl-terminal hydrolase
MTQVWHHVFAMGRFCVTYLCMQETSTVYTLKCNITLEVNYLSQGIAIGLKEDREKNSAALGRTVLFTGTSKISQLPPYLTVQMVRFYYKADVRQKAKILRKVSGCSTIAFTSPALAVITNNRRTQVTFPAELDLYEYCTEELQKGLDGPRAVGKALDDKAASEKKTKVATDASVTSTAWAHHANALRLCNVYCQSLFVTSCLCASGKGCKGRTCACCRCCRSICVSQQHRCAPDMNTCLVNQCIPCLQLTENYMCTSVVYLVMFLQGGMNCVLSSLTRAAVQTLGIMFRG